MWTGDIAPHDIWNVSRHEVLSQIKLVTNLMKQYTRVPVYPVIGNHEGVPVNRWVRSPVPHSFFRWKGSRDSLGSNEEAVAQNLICFSH